MFSLFSSGPPEPLDHAPDLLIFLGTSVEGASRAVASEQEAIKHVLQHNTVGTGAGRPTVWEKCVVFVDAADERAPLRLCTDVLQTISGSKALPQLFLLKRTDDDGKPVQFRSDIEMDSPLPMPRGVNKARCLFEPSMGKPSDLLLRQNELEPERQALTDLLAPVTGVDAPEMWQEQSTAAGDRVWVNVARYRRPFVRRLRPDTTAPAPAPASSSSSSSSSGAGSSLLSWVPFFGGDAAASEEEKEEVHPDCREMPDGKRITKGSRNLRYSRPPHMGGLVWEEVVLRSGERFWEHRETREVRADKPADADSAKLDTAAVATASSSCVVC